MPPVAQASLKPELNSTTHIHQIYIKAEPGAIWDAITSPEWNGSTDIAASATTSSSPAENSAASPMSRCVPTACPKSSSMAKSSR